MSAAVAKRYARALAAVATEDSRLEETGSELRRVVDVFADADLKSALDSPILTASARSAFVKQIADGLSLSNVVRTFLMLLAENNRLGELASIGRRYDRLVDEALGRVRALVRTAAPLSTADQDRLTQVLEKIVASKVMLTCETDPDLIAGVSIEVEGRVYDGSVRTQLAHLSKSMAQGALAK